MIKASVHYWHYKDTNDLSVIEAFPKKYTNTGDSGLWLPRGNDAAIQAMCYRLSQDIPIGSKSRKWLIHKLSRAPESDALLKLFIETALNKEEEEDTRIAAMNGLHHTKWSKAEAALTEIYIRINDEKYHGHMLEVAINVKNPGLAEQFLGYYRYFHPDMEYRSSGYSARFQEMEVSWWGKFFKKERKLTLIQARAGLDSFAKATMVERVELAYAIQQFGVADAELLKRMDDLVGDEPNSVVKMALITTVAAYQPTAKEVLEYYRRIAATEKDSEVVSKLQARIKLIESGFQKR